MVGSQIDRDMKCVEKESAAVAPAPDVACDLPDEGTAKVDFERQAHHFTDAAPSCSDEVSILSTEEEAADARTADRPMNMDILSGGGQLGRSHPGNVSFRTDFIRARSSQYDAAANREQKNSIASEILQDIANLKRRFLKQHPGAEYWTELDTKTAKEKVMMAFREYRKSQRNQQQAQQDSQIQRRAPLSVPNPASIVRPSSLSGNGGAMGAPNKKKAARPVLNVPPRGIGPITDPNENDILCGRGGINSLGNLQFRDIIHSQKSEYLDPSTKRDEKAHIAAGIVNGIRTMDPAGRFLKEDKGTGMWFDIGDAKAITKTGHALREEAASSDPSSPRPPRSSSCTETTAVIQKWLLNGGITADLRARVETFQTQVQGLDVESLRERYTPEELQQAVDDRTMYNMCNDYLHSHHLISVRATDNNKRKREDNNPKAEKEAKKLSDRAKKIATALAKEDESFQDNSWELNQMNAVVKCSLFIKDYNNDDEDDSRVKEMLWYSVEKDFFAIKCYDADNKRLFLGAAAALIPFNAIYRFDRTLEQKNWAVECRLRTKRLNAVIEMLLMMGGAISTSSHLLIPRLNKVLAYENNRHSLVHLMEILKSNCARAHQEGQDLHCSVNASKQIQLLIGDPNAVAAALADDVDTDVVAVDADVPAVGIDAGVAISAGVQSTRFQRADKLFEFPDESQLSLSGEEFDFYVKVHEEEWTNILKSIEDHKVKSAPLSEYITNLNLNIANATMEYVHYRKKDGSYEKSEKKVLVFGITWCIVAFCTGASGVSFCRNGDLVLRKFHEEVIVDGLGHVFQRVRFDGNDELRELAQKVDTGYYSVPVYFSSQFIPYIYKSEMRVATLQWAGILGSFYILAETCDHLKGDKEKNSILHTQPASKKENRDRIGLQGLAPLVGDRNCPQ